LHVDLARMIIQSKYVTVNKNQLSTHACKLIALVGKK
jgi:hypothetical protein